MRNLADNTSMTLIFLTTRPSAIKLDNGILADTCFGAGSKIPAKEIADAKRKFSGGHRLHAKSRAETRWLADAVTAYDTDHNDEYEDIQAADEVFDRGISGRFVREAPEPPAAVKVTTRNHSPAPVSQVRIQASSENLQTMNGRIKAEVCATNPHDIIKELARRLSKYEPSLRVVMTSDIVSGKNTIQIL